MIKTQLYHIDKLIINGDLSKAKTSLLLLLSSLQNMKMSLRLKNRIHFLEAAILCRRLSLFKEGIQLLANFVKSQNSRYNIESLAAEKAEYAALLYRLGLFAEADLHMSKVSSHEYVNAELIKGFSYISRWDYELAINHLEKYQQQDGLSAYNKLVAQVNILFGFVFLEKYSEGQQLALELLQKTKESASNLLYANTLEAISEIQINLGNYDEASNYLREAENLIQDSGSVDFFLIQKQKLFLRIRELGFTQLTQEKFDNFLLEAKKRKRYETIREMDFFKAKILKDFELASQVFAGTPYPGFRKKILKNFPELKESKKIIWNIGKIKTQIVIDLNELQKKLHPKLFKLVIALSEDHYLPKKMESLFNFIYDGESFDYSSAGDRVHQLIKRLRKALKQKKIPLKIKEENEFYVLQSVGNKTIEIIKNTNQEYHDHKLVSVLKLFDRKKISIQHFMLSPSHLMAKKLKKSQRTIQRIKKILKSKS